MNERRRLPKQGAGDAGRHAASVVDVFRLRAHEQGDRIAFTHVFGDDAPPIDRTYAELDAAARAVAARLQQSHSTGERALLMYDAGFDYITALAGCFYAGVTAVPVYPPDPMRAARTLPRLEAVVEDAQASILLGTASNLAWAGAMLGKLPRLNHLIPTDEIDPALANAWTQPALDRDTLAFLQYTSGSTGAPKGVMVRHGCLLANLDQMERVLDIDDAVAGIWLPAYHDMGLIGGILQCWYSGRCNVFMSPVTFFQNPLGWLQSVERYRVTTTGAPDFAYDLCVRKTRPEERAKLDLSSLQIALSGAEPVRAETIDAFVEAFAPCGVRREIFFPSFGMAEATLMVSGGRVDAPPVVRWFDSAELTRRRAVPKVADAAGAQRLVGCGRGVPGERIAIIDPDSLTTLPDAAIGEIWVHGPNVAGGYWNRPEESQRTFLARSADGDGPFLRTGDLGFVLDGELYISGRIKDLIIINGRNHHPQDIERTCEKAHEAAKTYGTAAFSVDVQGRERVVALIEAARPRKLDLDQVARAVRHAVLDAHDVALDAVELIQKGTLPKTTSGKLQRGECRRQFLAGELRVLHSWRSPRMSEGSPRPRAGYIAPRTPTEQMLADAWAEILGIERVGVDDDFFDLGGHSLLATQLANRLGPTLGEEMPLEQLFERPTIAALAELIDARRVAAEACELDFLEKLESMSEQEARAMLAGDIADRRPFNRSSAATRGAAGRRSVT